MTQSSFPDSPTDRLLRPGDHDYPPDLLDLGDASPSALHVRGDLTLAARRPRVAIVGTRRATPYGERVTREFAGLLARAGACIVSGLARGIDSAAHRAALDADGATIAVLGTGLDVAFPKGNRRLQTTIGQRGLLVSELEPGDHGMKFTFPRRNRIIAALSSLTIIVEAPEKSGALSTADHALELGRTVGVVPGPIDQPQSTGSNRLLLQGAEPLTCVEDALALVGLTPPPRTPRTPPEGPDGRVWSALARGSLTIDAICGATSLPAAECVAAVTRLELLGAVECLLSGQVRRR